MRIIAGNLRGKRLNTPEDESIRPTLDRVREAIFNMIAFDVPNSKVLDLFDGTGAMSLEAVSRGAKRASTVDNNKKSVQLIKENVKACRMEDKVDVFCEDYASFLAKSNKNGNKFDIIFVDPPYAGEMVQKVLEQIDENNVCSNRCIVILETDRGFDTAEETKHLIKHRERCYGKSKVSVYQMKSQKITESETV